MKQRCVKMPFSLSLVLLRLHQSAHFILHCIFVHFVYLNRFTYLFIHLSTEGLLKVLGSVYFFIHSFLVLFRISDFFNIVIVKKNMSILNYYRDTHSHISFSYK